MFDIGIQELIVIFVIVLLVFGPKKLPELARTMGKAFGQLRRAMYDIKAEVEREMQEEGGQIKHDLPDWKQKYPINKAPSKEETETPSTEEAADIENQEAEEDDTSPASPDTALKNSESQSPNDSSSKDPSTPAPSDETRDS